MISRSPKSKWRCLFIEPVFYHCHLFISLCMTYYLALIIHAQNCRRMKDSISRQLSPSFPSLLESGFHLSGTFLIFLEGKHPWIFLLLLWPRNQQLLHTFMSTLFSKFSFLPLSSTTVIVVYISLFLVSFQFGVTNQGEYL